jgi:hypothetical protein
MLDSTLIVWTTEFAKSKDDSVIGPVTSDWGVTPR